MGTLNRVTEDIINCSLDKDVMIKDIMEKIDALPPEKQEVLCDLISDVLDDLKAMREEK